MNPADLMGLMRGPSVTEKSMRLAERHKQFAFLVKKEATKPNIKKLVEMVFKVEVAAVQVVNLQGKRKRAKNQKWGRRSAKRKAYVTLKPGFDINFSNI